MKPFELRHDDADGVDMSILAPVPLRESFAVGDPEIDRQHQHFIERVNELSAAVVAGATNRKIGGLARVMIADARAHFAHEDVVLSRLNIAGASAHTAEHRRLEAEMDRLLDMLGRLCPSTAKSAFAVAVAMRAMLLDHLLYYDLRYKSQLMREAGR